MCDQLSFDSSPSRTTALVDDTPFGKVLALLDNRFLLQTEIRLKETKSKYSSIVVHSPKTDYREASASNLLFARLWDDQDVPYLSFNKRFSQFFRIKQIEFEEAETGFIRIDLDSINTSLEMRKNISYVFNRIFKDLVSFDRFDCCSRYLQCSNEKDCVHPDYIFASCCSYNKKLADGIIFWGANRNID